MNSYHKCVLQAPRYRTSRPVLAAVLTALACPVPQGKFIRLISAWNRGCDRMGSNRWDCLSNSRSPPLAWSSFSIDPNGPVVIPQRNGHGREEKSRDVPAPRQPPKPLELLQRFFSIAPAREHVSQQCRGRGNEARRRPGCPPHRPDLRARSSPLPSISEGQPD